VRNDSVILLGLLLAALPFSARLDAAELTAFPTTDMNPFAQVFGLPAPGDATVLAGEAYALDASIAAGNVFSTDSNASEDARLDGEVQRVTVTLRHGLGNRLEWGLELPFVSHGGGQLDQLIVTWHDWFNLPDGNRSLAPKNAFEYRYTRDGVDVIHLTEPVSGMGDVRVTMGYALPTASRPTALRASLKLPTGDSAMLLGSGGADFALWLSSACGARCAGGFGWYGSGGLLYAGQGEVLPAQQRHVIGFGSAGLGYRALPALDLKVQLDAHSGFFGQTDLPEIGAASVQIVLGLTWRLADSYSLDFALGEELVHNTSVDLALLLRVGARF
jgi:hypothetical protein